MSTTVESESEQIRKRMASLRQRMHVNAQQVFENTNRLFDWRDYVQQFPKGILVAGLLTGYVLSPGRRVTRSVKLTKESIEELRSGQESISSARVGTQPTLMSVALRILSGVAVSGASLLLRKGIDAYLNKQHVESPTSADNYFGRS